MEPGQDSCKYVLSLNYEGVNYRVEVNDLETANLLLNDASAATQYMKSILEASSASTQTQLETSVFESPEGSPLSSPDIYELPTEESETILSTAEDNTIWTKKKPTSIDNEATSLLLQLRKRKQKFFEDKKTRKMQLWKEIATELEQKGFHLGIDAWQRCRQKFANLQKAYMNYITNQKTTGTGSIEEPPFFSELHALLGDKHKVVPVKLVDSLSLLEMESSNQSNSGGTSSITLPQEIIPIIPEPLTRPLTVSAGVSDQQTTDNINQHHSNRFSMRNRKIVPSRQDALIKEIQEDRKARKEEFNFYKEHLQRSQEQRDRLLNILEQVVKDDQTGKKRKRDIMDFSDSD